MSEQQEQKPENKNLKDKFLKKPNLPKNPFNFYWIYGIIAVVLIGIQLMSSGGSLKEKNTTEFIETMLKQHHVVRIVALTAENIAEITIGQ